MKNILNIYIVLISLLLVGSCNTGPQPIDYGNDGCHFCFMTIVDKIHGAELITDKGKVYKFDAAECVVNYLNENKAMPVGSLLTNYYEAPTELITIEEATFLICEKLPSPMGANLTAFKTKENADNMQAKMGGKIYTWDALKKHFNK